MTNDSILDPQPISDLTSEDETLDLENRFEKYPGGRRASLDDYDGCSSEHSYGDRFHWLLLDPWRP